LRGVKIVFRYAAAPNPYTNETSMATSGYSNTPLLKKLGITENTSVSVINMPENYSDLLQTDITQSAPGKNQVPDLVHAFVKDEAEFKVVMKKLEPMARKNNKIVIWISWYKKASGIKTDLTEDVIRNYALKHDLVDVKVCAVSDLWSGLKLVVPLNKRN
jgi:hypothetical protein